MRNRNLNGLDIKLFRKRDGVLDRLPRFAGEAEDEVAMNHQSQLVSVFGELPRAFQGGALLDVLQDLRIA